MKIRIPDESGRGTSENVDDAQEPHLKTGITLTPHSPWVWHVSLDGTRVGTVNGDSMFGFTARDINHRSIGHGYFSAEAAMQAWTSPRERQPTLNYPPGAFTFA
jgi:hypothetical protein